MKIKWEKWKESGKLDVNIYIYGYKYMENYGNIWKYDNVYFIRQ